MELNITYRNKTANPERNKAIYSRYVELLQEDVKKGDAVKMISAEFGTGYDNVRRIITQIEKKLKKAGVISQ